MDHEIIFQIIPYLQYLLIIAAVAGGIIGGIKFIHRKGVIHGVDTIRGAAIQKDICDLKKEYEEDKKHEGESHRLLHKKIDENKDSIHKIAKDVASSKATVELLTNFIINGKKVKFKINDAQP